MSGVKDSALTTFPGSGATGNITRIGNPNNVSYKETLAAGRTRILAGLLTDGYSTDPLGNCTIDASLITSGTLPNGRFPATLPVINGSNITNLTSGNLVGSLPAIDGSALTNLTSGNLVGALPAISGASLTSLPGANITGTIPNNSLPTLNQDLKFTDATFDIGKTGATRPRDLFISRDLTVGRTSNLILGTITTDLPVIDSTVTWNNAGTTFHGIRLKISNTAAGGSSMPFQIFGGSTGTTNLFSVDVSGSISFNAGSSFPGTTNVTNLTLSGNLRVAGDITGAGATAGFGTNSPATTLTAPYTWVKFISSDGSTVYVPAYK